jgi:hypothetical protein
MENENTNLAEETALTAEEDAAFESEWGEPAAEADDFDLGGEDAEETTDAQPEETEATEEAGEDEEPADSADDSPEEGAEAQPEPEKAANDQRYKLKHNGEETEVDYDKVIELAQKGMDYDRVREERDRFRVEAPTLQKYRERDEFLENLAKNSNMTVDELIENTRKMMLMQEDPELSEEEATEKVRGEKAAKEEPKDSDEERRQAMFANFVMAYPDVKPDEIPQEVWEDAARTFDLTGAFQRHENRKLKAEIATLRQNNKNKDRSTGSRRSVGATTPKDAFDEGWDSSD